MNIRLFICILLVCILGTAYGIEAQQAGKVTRIGYLSRNAGPGASHKPFMQGLRDLGWHEGTNIRIERRWAAFKMGRLPTLATELVGMKVDLIVTGTSQVTRAAMNATHTIPIVMRSGAEVVENGLVKSLAQPGGNITGMSEEYSQVHTKLLAVLHEALPHVTRVAFLWDPDSQTYSRTYRAVQPLAPEMGLTLQSLALGTKSKSKKALDAELESMLAAMAQNRAGALLAMSRLYRTFGPRIAEFTIKNRIPVFSISAAAIKKYSGLLAYSPDFEDMSRRAAKYVDRILKGTKPANLPVERPRKFSLFINLKNANQIGITIPPNLLVRATEVIR